MKKLKLFLFLTGIILSFVILNKAHAQLETEKIDSINIGFNYPETGPYAAQGLDQKRAFELAIEEINAKGGVLGKSLKLIIRNSESKPALAAENALDIITNHNIDMLTGGVSSGVAISVSAVAQKSKTLFMATITASNATTGEKGHRYTFRSCYNAWMGAKALSEYLNEEFKDKTFFYVVANYSWGWSSEKSIRKFTHTEDKSIHRAVYIPFPNATEKDFVKAIKMAKIVEPDVLVLVLFGDDMSTAIRLATVMGIKKQARIVVPILELALAEGSGPGIMEGVIGTADWIWKVPYEYNYERGKEFVETFLEKYNRYPGWSAANAYSIMYQYKDAVERAKSTEATKLIKTLEGHQFSFLKDEEYWRDFDHQKVQSVYVVECKPKNEVRKSLHKLDYFKILKKYSGESVVQTKEEWDQRRIEAELPTHLEPLETEITE